MSIYRNRMVRIMGKDLFLPVKCYTPTKEQFYSLLGECKCMTECKFSRESKHNTPVPKRFKDSTRLKI